MQPEKARAVENTFDKPVRIFCFFFKINCIFLWYLSAEIFKQTDLGLIERMRCTLSGASVPVLRPVYLEHRMLDNVIQEENNSMAFFYLQKNRTFSYHKNWPFVAFQQF